MGLGPETRKKIEELLDLSVSELERRLDEEYAKYSRWLLPSDARSAIPLPPLSWFANFKEQIADAVYGDQTIRKYVESPDRAELVHAVRGAISEIVVGVDTITVAALVVKRGVYARKNGRGRRQGS